MFYGCPLDRLIVQDSETCLVSESGMLNGCPMDVQMDRLIVQDSDTCLVSEGGMSNGCPMDVPMDIYWTGGLDKTVGQA